MNSFPGTEYVVTGVFLLSLITMVAGSLIAVGSSRLIRSVCGLAMCCIGLAGLYYFLHECAHMTLHTNTPVLQGYLYVIEFEACAWTGLQRRRDTPAQGEAGCTARAEGVPDARCRGGTERARGAV